MRGGSAVGEDVKDGGTVLLGMMRWGQRTVVWGRGGGLRTVANKGGM